MKLFNGRGLPVAKTRNYGIDLLRMLSMLMIIVLHMMGNGGILAAAEPQSAHYWVAWALETAAYCAVNCYALISGYVGVDAEHRGGSIVTLWLQVAFYTLSLTVLFAIFLPGSVTANNVLRALLPVTFRQYWYFTSYFCLFFFLPALNHLFTLPQAKLRRLIWAVILLLSLLPTLRGYDLFQTNAGYSVLWLGGLYLLGGYLKRYQPLKFLGLRGGLVVYGACTIVSWLWKLIAESLALPIDSGRLINYTAPTILLASVGLLTAFASLRLSAVSRKITGIAAPLAFSVYLIHAQPLVWDHLIKGRFSPLLQIPPLAFAGAVIVVALGIYLVCSVIDLLRFHLFRLLRIRKLADLFLRTTGTALLGLTSRADRASR